jgi:hypothetical protein
VLGFAHRHLKQDSEARRYLTTAIFPVYILHQTVIVICAHALKPANLQPGVEALLLVLVTASVCFLSYEVIRRVVLLRPLFGLALAASGSRRPVAVALASPQALDRMRGWTGSCPRLHQRSPQRTTRVRRLAWLRSRRAPGPGFRGAPGHCTSP